MATATRSALAAIALLLVQNAALGQISTAPPPHLALHELVKEYRQLEMPLPPADAPLVRIRFVFTTKHERERGAPWYFVGFQLAPTKPERAPRYLIGWGRRWTDEWFAPEAVEQIEPKADALTRVPLWSMSDDEYLSLAIHCRLRGWDELAHAAYARVREQNDEIAAMNGTPAESLIETLRWHSLRYWGGRGDRKEYLKRLKALCELDPTFKTPGRVHEMKCLELTLAPRKSKPGSIEALIDDLIDYYEDPDNPTDTKGQEAYWKLVELGFDAVPALIEHLSDDRFSRGVTEGFNNFRPYTLTVGHLCSRLLFDLSARTIGGTYWALRGDRLDPKHAREWFDRAKKVGEEKWLLDHAVPPGKLEPIENQDGRPEAHLFRVIGAKYPDKLPDLYRAVLRKPDPGYGDYINEILASKLTREKKIALFEEGLQNKNPEHRMRALKGLAAIDKPRMRKHLSNWLKEMFAKLKDGKEVDPGPAEVFDQVIQDNDRDCWDMLLLATQLSDYSTKTFIIFELTPWIPPDQPDPLRGERLRFLLQFVNDPATPPAVDDSWGGMKVCDFAAAHLAGMFRFPVERDFAPYYRVRPDPDLGPITRLGLRAIVSKMAEDELAGTGK